MDTRSIAVAEREEPALVYAAFSILRKEVERALSEWKVTVPQALVLIFVDEAEGPVSVSDLARFLMQESPSVTTLLDRMSKRGLVKRVQDPHDRRKVAVSLTSRGKNVRDQIRQPALEAHEYLFGVLSDKERASLKKLLRKFRRGNIQHLRGQS